MSKSVFENSFPAFEFEIEKESIKKQISQSFQEEGIPLTYPFAARLDDIIELSEDYSKLLKTSNPITYENLREIFSLSPLTGDQQSDRISPAVLVDPTKFEAVHKKLKSKPAKIFVDFLYQLVYKRARPDTKNQKIPQADYLSSKIHVCNKAEIYFTKYIAWRDFIEKEGLGVNFDIIIGEHEPLAIIKRGSYLGAKNSALTLRPFSLNSVVIQPGSVVSAFPSEKKIYEKLKDKSGKIIPLEDCGFKFYRFSQFAFDPQQRRQVSEADYEDYKANSNKQGVDSEYIDTLRLEDFYQGAERHLKS